MRSPYLICEILACIDQVVGNKTSKTAKKTRVNHHKKRTSKAKVSVPESHKSKTCVDREAVTARCQDSANTATAVTARCKDSADTATSVTARRQDSADTATAVTARCQDSADTATAVTARRQDSADTATAVTAKCKDSADTATSKATAGRAAELVASKASPDNCTETAKSKVSAEKVTGAVVTAAMAGEDSSLPLPFTAAPTHKPNVVFIDSINSFRCSCEWHSPSKVLP